MECKELNFKEEYERINREILNWTVSNEKFLSIISLPYNSPSIFLDVIISYVEKMKKVLYITNELRNNVNIIECIKNYTCFREYSYFDGKKDELKTLTITNYRGAAKIKEKYDLVIYDDISIYSEYSKYEILDILSKYCNKDNKIIIYSSQNIIKGQKELFIYGNKNEKPIAEPRIMLTKINTDVEIPYSAYEYLDWSIKNNRKAVIYAYNGDKVNNIYSYLVKIKDKITENIFYYKKENENKQAVFNFNQLKRGILVTDDFKEEIISDYSNLDIIVCFSNEGSFGYKKLIFSCGRIGRGENKKISEVVFLCNRINGDIELVRDTTRAFNKKAWEKGLLNI